MLLCASHMTMVVGVEVHITTPPIFSSSVPIISTIEG